MIDLPIDEVLDDDVCARWLEQHLHPDVPRPPVRARWLHMSRFLSPPVLRQLSELVQNTSDPLLQKCQIHSPCRLSKARREHATDRQTRSVSGRGADESG